MDRLTKLGKNGMYGLAKVKDNEQEIESSYPNTLRAIGESFQQLAAYEETGLAPTEIVAMREELEKAKKDITSLANGEYSICDMCGLYGDAKDSTECPYGCYYSKIEQKSYGTYPDDPCDEFQYNRSSFPAPVALIPAPANRVLSLAEVLALPEGARVWVEHNRNCLTAQFPDEVHYMGQFHAGRALWSNSNGCWELANSTGYFGRGYRVWSLPVAPTEDELRGNAWGKEGE